MNFHTYCPQCVQPVDIQKVDGEFYVGWCEVCEEQVMIPRLDLSSLEDKLEYPDLVPYFVQQMST